MLFYPANPEEFVKYRDRSTRSQFLTPTPAAELVAHRLFLNMGATVGYALSPDGDLQSVFNNGLTRGAGKLAILDAIKRGARTLDAFDGYLVTLYTAFGFKAVSRTPFNYALAPVGWDFELNGHPDVVFMVYMGGPRETIQDRVGFFPFWPWEAGTFTWYKDAKAAQQSAAEAMVE